VLLSPAPAQTYRIVGAHERRDFTACSPMRPRRCRNLDLHRFELDCGGAKVTWLSVVAALAPWAEAPGRIRGGKMQVDFGPGYSSRGPVPCVVPVPYGPPGRFGPRGFYGPPGFYYGPRLMVVPCPGGPVPRQFADLPAGFAPVPTQLVSFKSFPEPVAQIEAAPPSPVAKAAPGSAPSQATGSGTAENTVAERAPSASELAPDENETTGSITTPSVTAPRSNSRDMIGAIGFGFAALFLFGTALFLSRRRSRAVAIRPGTGVHAFDEKGAPRPLATAFQDVREQAPSRPPDEEERLPSSLGEALIVLCASPETDRDMLKELVKGLRRRWHPDHALNEADRRARERKLKQINIAWDIVCGKRRARRPSTKPSAA
jgi:hypothetical protein